MFHIGSILLGLLAWVFGVAAITVPKTVSSLKNMYLSFSLCSVSLLLQFFEINRLVRIEDLSAVMDTINAVSIAALALITVTIVLNITAVIKAKKRS